MCLERHFRLLLSLPFLSLSMLSTGVGVVSKCWWEQLSTWKECWMLISNRKTIIETRKNLSWDQAMCLGPVSRMTWRLLVEINVQSHGHIIDQQKKKHLGLESKMISNIKMKWKKKKRKKKKHASMPKNNWRKLWLKALAWAGGFGFQLLWAEPKPLLGRHLWPGLAWPKRAQLGLASGFGLGQAHH